MTATAACQRHPWILALALAACSPLVPPSQGATPPPAAEPAKAPVATGTVHVDVNQALKALAGPRGRRLLGNGFSTNEDIRDIKLTAHYVEEAEGTFTKQSVSNVTAFSASGGNAISLTVPASKRVIYILEAQGPANPSVESVYSAGSPILARAYAHGRVNAGDSLNLTINGLTDAVGKALYAAYQDFDDRGSQFPDWVNQDHPASLTAEVRRLTGYDEATHSYTKVHPLGFRWREAATRMTQGQGYPLPVVPYETEGWGRLTLGAKQHEAPNLECTLGRAFLYDMSPSSRTVDAMGRQRFAKFALDPKALWAKVEADNGATAYRELTVMDGVKEYAQSVPPPSANRLSKDIPIGRDVLQYDGQLLGLAASTNSEEPSRFEVLREELPSNNAAKALEFKGGTVLGQSTFPYILNAGQLLMTSFHPTVTSSRELMYQGMAGSVPGPYYHTNHTGTYASGPFSGPQYVVDHATVTPDAAAMDQVRDTEEGLLLAIRQGGSLRLQSWFVSDNTLGKAMTLTTGLDSDRVALSATGKGNARIAYAKLGQIVTHSVQMDATASYTVTAPDVVATGTSPYSVALLRTTGAFKEVLAYHRKDAANEDQMCFVLQDHAASANRAATLALDLEGSQKILAMAQTGELRFRVLYLNTPTSGTPDVRTASFKVSYLTGNVTMEEGPLTVFSSFPSGARAYITALHNRAVVFAIGSPALVGNRASLRVLTPATAEGV